jgi:hypothetical protein
MVIMRWARNSEGTWWHAVLATICEIKYKSGIAEYVVTGDVFYVCMFINTSGQFVIYGCNIGLNSVLCTMYYFSATICIHTVS